MEMQISIADLGKFAEAFWKYVKSSKVFAFHGDMGTGKTTIIKILCKHKGVLDSMSSPSFSIINEYEYKNNGETKRIFHIDLYRLKNAEEAVHTGVQECIDSGEICFVEWAEKAPQLFDEKTWHVMIEPVTKNKRSVKMHSAIQSSADIGEQL